jgi:hypothetical protein
MHVKVSDFGNLPGRPGSHTLDPHHIFGVGIGVYANVMAKWKQYELWVQAGEQKWEIVGVFPDTEVPTAVAGKRRGRARLIEMLFDGDKLLGQEVIAEIGLGREAELSGGDA